jgi:hypothetical protein
LTPITLRVRICNCSAASDRGFAILETRKRCHGEIGIYQQEGRGVGLEGSARSESQQGGQIGGGFGVDPKSQQEKVRPKAFPDPLSMALVRGG